MSHAEMLYLSLGELRIAYQSRPRAANICMGYWLGSLRWQLSPQRLKTEVIRTMPKVVYEFHHMFDFTLDIERYRQITCQVTLLGVGSPGIRLWQ